MFPQEGLPDKAQTFEVRTEWIDLAAKDACPCRRDSNAAERIAPRMIGACQIDSSAPSAAISPGEWKLINWREDGAAKFYLSVNNPDERYNLTRLNLGASEGLEQRLDAELQQVDANIPSANLAYGMNEPTGQPPPGDR